MLQQQSLPPPPIYLATPAPPPPPPTSPARPHLSADLHQQLHLVLVVAGAAVDADSGQHDAGPVHGEGHCVRAAVARVPERYLRHAREAVGGYQQRACAGVKVNLQTTSELSLSG